MKLALDVDGVLADVIETWLIYNNKIRTPLSKQDLVDWDFWKRFKIDQFVLYEELSQCWSDWTAIPPTEENLSQTTENLSAIAQIDIVTAREKSTNIFVKNWLTMHGITYDNYVSVIAGPAKAELDYDIFIDDSPLNAAAFLQNNKKVLLYSQPWNQHLADTRLRRISCLSEAVNILGS